MLWALQGVEGQGGDALGLGAQQGHPQCQGTQELSALWMLPWHVVGCWVFGEVTGFLVELFGFLVGLLGFWWGCWVLGF